MKSIVIAAILLLAPVQAGAECAWMLWAGVLDSDRQREWSPSRPPRVTAWRPVAAYPTKPDCQEQGLRHQDVDTRYSREVVEYNCFPDTVDPRAPKGSGR